MQSTKTRIRKEFTPLTVAVSVRCTTPASPTTQVNNGNISEYEPDRELTPTIILPEVVANASDGSWGEPYSNSALANMKWFANGVNIATLDDWTDKYSIDQVGSTRGALTVKRNVSPSEQISLHFEADLVDTRLGVTLPIKTDHVMLTTSQKSDDNYSLSLSDGNNIQYDPTLDNLNLYEYKVAHELITASADAKAAATDTSAYLHEIPFAVFCGKNEVTSGYMVKVYRVDSTTTRTELNSSSPEIAAITLTKVTLDLRLITQDAFIIEIVANDKVVASTQIGVSRIYQGYSISPTNGTSIHPSDTQRYDRVQVDANGNIVECPGRIYEIVWYTNTSAKSSVRHNNGETTVIELSATGIGSTSTDCWLEVYVDCEYKTAYSVATDASGNTYTDSSGNPFIFN